MASTDVAAETLTRYTVVLLRDPEETTYTVLVPALPGCITVGDTVGDTMEEAFADAREAIAGHVATSRDVGEDVPREPAATVVATVAAGSRGTRRRPRPSPPRPERGEAPPVECPFCAPAPDRIQHAGVHCLVLDTRDPVLVGSVMIIPRAHRVTPFDLTPAEWAETGELLGRVKTLLDARQAPDGYNVGWNCGAAGGQEVLHAHLHVIPRHRDEPLAGKGIRHWLKQPANARP